MGPPRELLGRLLERASWPRGEDARLLGLALLVVAAAWGFVELADDVIEGDTRAVDEGVLRALRSDGDPAVPIGPRWLRQVARDLTALGSVAVLSLVVAGACGWLLLVGKRGATLLVLGATAGGGLLAAGLKGLFARARPDVVPHLDEVSSASFPSGHSMLSAVVYLTLGALLARLTARRRERLFVLSVALGLTGLVGATRVYLGVHYPSDVLAGWAAGLAWALAWWTGAAYLQRRGRVEPPS